MGRISNDNLPLAEKEKTGTAYFLNDSFKANVQAQRCCFLPSSLGCMFVNVGLYSARARRYCVVLLRNVVCSSSIDEVQGWPGRKG
jgi:hypothetical protein